MERILFISTMLFIMFSCSKEQNTDTRELNISLKSMESVCNITTTVSMNFYPNPFQNSVAIHVNGADSAQLLIRNDKGDTKRIVLKTSNGMLDFTGEKAGTYYCEALVNNTVFRTYLIKY